MTKVSYNLALLEEVLKRDGATLVEAPSHLNRDVVISFKCSCGECHQKNFRILNEKGAFCKGCMAKKSMERVRATNMERRGCEYPTQSKLVREKTKVTNMERLGVENSFQSKVVREKAKATNMERRGCEYPTQSKLVKEKVKATNMERLGVENPFQSETCKQKIKQTNIVKYGVENTSQSQDFQAKIIATNIKKYGTRRPTQNKVIQENMKQRNKKKYGVEYTLQLKEVKEKGIQTNLRKYGVENANQSREIQERGEKNSHKFKPFTMPSGEIRKVQGYEHFALRDLLKSYTEDQIVTGRKNVPVISYSTENGKRRVHFPDIFLPHENKIIEVKSIWTYNCKADCVLLKKSFAEAQGYSYEIWCYDVKGVRVMV